ncbi:MAG: hypothetical protein RJB65_1554, partial [Actinomycetota bacterium]
MVDVVHLVEWAVERVEHRRQVAEVERSCTGLGEEPELAHRGGSDRARLDEATEECGDVDQAGVEADPRGKFGAISLPQAALVEEFAEARVVRGGDHEGADHCPESIEIVSGGNGRDLIVELGDEARDPVVDCRPEQLGLGAEALGDRLVAEAEFGVERPDRGAVEAEGREGGEGCIEDGLVGLEGWTSSGRHGHYLGTCQGHRLTWRLPRNRGGVVVDRRVWSAVVVGVVLLAGCGGASTAGTATTESTVAETVASEPGTTDSVSLTTEVPAPDTTDVSNGIVNVWVAEPVDLTRLPIGTEYVSTEGPSVGGLFACSAGNPAGGGAFVAGPWMDEAAGTWDATAKISVEGSVEWEMARYSEVVDGGVRSIASSGLPVGHVTGTFPIAATDPAFAYDRNPNTISQNDVVYDLPVVPEIADEPSCLPPASIAIMRNGVVVFAPLDELNRDAVAWETQDVCDGHPQQVGIYHYH